MIFCLGAFAQVKKVVISTPTIQCGMCKNKIEKTLSRYDGVQSVVVNVKKKTTTVSYLKDRINVEQIKTNIANTGYDADNVTANEDIYAKLPACCKKPAEGEAAHH